jgi:hypothetical protein
LSDSDVSSDTGGGRVVYVKGNNFGPASLSPPALQDVGFVAQGLSYTFAADCVVSRDHVELRCVTGPGVGARLLWWVTVASQVSTNPRTSYARPSITSIAVASAVTGELSSDDSVLQLLRTVGGQLMVIRGDNLATDAFLESVVGVDATGRSVPADRCRVAVEGVEVHCDTPPSVGVGFRWIVRVAGQDSAPSTDTTSYEPPQVSVVTVSGGSMLPTAGSGVFIIVGSGFGVDGAAVEVTWNGVPLPSPFMLEPQTSIGVATLPGEGFSVTIGLAVGGQRVNLTRAQSVFEFEAPVVTDVRLNTTAMSGVVFDCSAVGANGIGRGGVSSDRVALIISGRSFGAGPHTVVRIGSTVCDGDRSLWTHTRITCMSPQCVGASLAPCVLGVCVAVVLCCGLGCGVLTSVLLPR